MGLRTDTILFENQGYNGAGRVVCFDLDWICSFLSTILTIHSFYYLCMDSTWINPTYRNLTLSVLTLLTCTIILDGTKLVIWQSNQQRITLYWFILTDTAIFIYFLGNILFYILLLIRISKPFDLKKIWVIPLSSLIVLFAITSIVYFVEDI